MNACLGNCSQGRACRCIPTDYGKAERAAHDVQLLDTCKNILLAAIQAETCPFCGAEDFDRCHAQASFALPETYYNVCNTCGRQWGHE